MASPAFPARSFSERFGKLQDLLGNVFRELLALSGEATTDMNDVLSRLEKIDMMLPGGMRITGAEDDAWLAELEAGNDVEPPARHT